MRTRILALLLLSLCAFPLAAASADGPDDRDRVQRLIEQVANDPSKAPAAILRFGPGRGEPVLAFSFGVSNTATIGGGGGGAGKATFQDVAFVKPITASSKEFFLGCATGKHYPTATLEILDSKGVVVAQVRLTDVLVSSYQVGGGGDSAMESVTLNFVGIDYILIAL